MGFLSGWLYRKSHVIESAVGAGTNYQKRIVVHYGAGADLGEDVYCDSKCKTDFGDIRFTEDDEITELDYWMESKTDSDNAVFWVEISDNLDSNQTIYIYYGNDSVSTTSNFDDTFIFGDPFDNVVLDNARWASITGNPIYTIDAVNHYIEITDLDVGWYGGLGFHSRTDIVFPSQYIVEDAYSALGFKLWHNSTIDTETFQHLLIVAHTDWGFPADMGVAFAYIGNHWGSDLCIAVEAGVGGDIDYTSGKTCPSLPYSSLFKIWKLSGVIKIDQDGTERVSEANAESPDRIHMGLGKFSGLEFDTVRFYAFKIRKYTSPEPAHGDWGSEEVGVQYRLTVQSSPVFGIVFTYDGNPQTTPYISDSTDLGTIITLIMPVSQLIGKYIYLWSKWENEDTNRTRQVTLNSDMTVTGYFLRDWGEPAEIEIEEINKPIAKIIEVEEE